MRSPSGSVAVTRAEGPGGRLSAALEARGLAVVRWPTVDIRPPSDPGPLQQAVDTLPAYDWVVLSSPRAAAALLAAAAGPPPAPPDGPRFAVVGIATAEALTAEGWPVHLVPKPFNGKALVEAFAQTGWAADARVLFPASEIARDEIPDGLKALGARLEQVEAYRTVDAGLDAATVLSDLSERDVRIVTFTSPSAVAGLRRAVGEAAFTTLFESCRAAAIGPVTAAALGAEQIPSERIVTAEVSTLDGLSEAVAHAMQQE